MAFKVDKSLALQLLVEEYNKYCKLQDFYIALGNKLTMDEMYDKVIIEPFQDAEYTIIKSIMRWISIAGKDNASKRLHKCEKPQHYIHLLQLYDEWMNEFGEKEVQDGFEEWNSRIY